MQELRWGTTRIPYAVSRSARQKTLSIRVEPTGDVHVVAPEATSPERIEAIVRKKAAGIVERKRRIEDVPPPPAPRLFVTGESSLYLGRQYRLRVVAGAGIGVRLRGRWLEVDVARGVPAEDRPTLVRSLLIDWYRRRAAARLPERAARWAAHIGVEPRAVFIRDQKRRWGSCDAAGNVRFNWRVVQAPMKLVDYVVAHELVHLVHEDHGREFWGRLGQVMPDYEERRAGLRRIGGQVKW